MSKNLVKFASIWDWSRATEWRRRGWISWRNRWREWWSKWL